MDEVATDSATRGALKDDQAFKNLRDVIKKCNKVLEKMLVRRDNKYTLFFRLVQSHDVKEISKMKMWNERVEKAVHSLSSDEAESVVPDLGGEVGGGSDIASTVSSSTEASSGSKGGLFRRGRGLLPTAGRVRARRATPTPSLRNQYKQDAPHSSAEDGYARSTPVTSGNLAKLQNSLEDEEQSSMKLPGQFVQSEPSGATQSTVEPMAPKDELVDVIKGLRNEQSRTEVSIGVQPGDLKPNWLPKGDIPITVPKLPVEYIHRHRLMKQVVNHLLDRQTTAQDGSEPSRNHLITSITSRHADKAGNGKTTLAVAAIQTVEVRERFSDGIAWIQLGRAPLTEKNIKRLYEELYDQLLENDVEINSSYADGDVKNTVASQFLKSRMKFRSGDLEGMKEYLGQILCEKRVLICLDDVWRVDDAKRFIFPHVDERRNENFEKKTKGNSCPYKVLLTTRTPGLLGHGNSCEVFVRIFSENEAVKLLLSAAGRRLYGGKNSPVFNQARVIVKGCGNSPLALRLAGGMLRRSNRNWTLSCPTWLSLVDQCRSSLEEASKIRSFVNSVGRVVDLSFITVQNIELRRSLRRCFVTFAMVFRDNEMLLTGKGIPRSVVEQLFQTVISVMSGGAESESPISPDNIIEVLERMNLLQRAGHGSNHEPYTEVESSENIHKSSIANNSKSLFNGSLSLEDGGSDDFQSTVLSEDASSPAELTSYLMHESIKGIAEDMSTRISTSFAPISDDFTSFNEDLEAESQKEDTDRHWFSNAAKYLFSSNQDQEYRGTARPQFHELMVCALSGGSSELEKGQIAKVFKENKKPCTNREAGDNMEKYITSYLPNHLINAGMFADASFILIDNDFILRRMSCLGVPVATRRHMQDILDLRRELQRISDENGRILGPPISQTDDTPHLDLNVDIAATQREASRIVLEAVYEGEKSATQSARTLHMASCLYAVGEAFLKARLFRESIRHLEKCIDIFHEILGAHFDVARSLNLLSKACLKIGESESAITKLEEAKAVYKDCEAMAHYEAIANSHHMANLYLDTGNWDKASLEYQHVLNMKSKLYGGESLPVAKALNEFAVLLAKNNRLSESLQQYESARAMYESISRQSDSGLVFVASLGAKNPQHKFLSDVTLIDLNIASLNSKLSNYQGALKSYERGVAGLRLQLKHEESDSIDNSRQVAQRRHLVSAIARIGSLRMKLKDNNSALKAYMVLIKEVDHSSPTQSQMEKAKAHVKCATIFRQSGGKENNENAVAQLELALQMYTVLHGQNHKDTKAISSSLRQWQRIDSTQP